MPETVRISVVTVAYRSASTIGETLRSVAAQEYPHVEHIVIDGASPDNTMDIVERELRAGGSAVSEPDEGLYDAMNKGFQRSNGDILGILNADDVYADDAVLAEVAEVFEDPAIDIVYGDLVYFSDGDPDRIVRRYSSQGFTPDRLEAGWMPAHPTLYMRRSLLDAVGPLRTDYRIAADFEHCVRIFSHPDVRALYLPRVMVRMRTGGLSTRGIGSTFTIGREIVRALHENGRRVSWLGMVGRYAEKGIDALSRRLQPAR